MIDLPVIKTERLLLRNLLEKDADAMFEYAANKEVSKYLLWTPHKNKHETITAIRRFKLSEHMMQWAIVLKKTGQLIGVGGFGIVDRSMRKADLGYSFNPGYWNSGYATEMTIALIEYGFDKLNLVRIQGAIHPENKASGKVLKKCGLSYEATLKNWMLIDDQPVDTMIYAITSPAS